MNAARARRREGAVVSSIHVPPGFGTREVALNHNAMSDTWMMSWICGGDSGSLARVASVTYTCHEDEVI